MNVHNSLQIGTSQWLEYERQWPAGFHKKLTKKSKDHGSSYKTDYQTWQGYAHCGY